MAQRFNKTSLRRLRNEIQIRDLIADILHMPWKVSEGHFRFLCPRCHEFNTATNPNTNLARCFRCEENFNPIDMTMVEKRFDFREAVDFLHQFLHNHGDIRDIPRRDTTPTRAHLIRDG